MTVRQQWAVVAAVVVALGAAGWAAVAFFGEEFAPVTVGSRAPNFKAVTLDPVPATRTFADYKGHVTLVNIWATFCKPCETEMPALQQMYSEYGGKGLRLAAVSVDFPGMESAIRTFTQRFGITFDVLYDSHQSIMKSYMTTGYPETFVIGKDGTIRFHQIGTIERDTLQLHSLLDRLLAEPAS